MKLAKKTFVCLLFFCLVGVLIYLISRDLRWKLPDHKETYQNNNFVKDPSSALRIQDDKAKGFVTFLVTRVIDGDTIETENGSKIRYIGIDSPEINDPRKSIECFSQQAKNYNQELVLNKRVRLEKDISKTDRYGRLLRYVYVGDDLINLKLVEQGFALSAGYPPDIKYQNKFLKAEQKARQEKRGLWAECHD